MRKIHTTGREDWDEVYSQPLTRMMPSFYALPVTGSLAHEWSEDVESYNLYYDGVSNAGQVD